MVTGMTMAAATQALEQAGFAVTVKQTATHGTPGSVDKQTPAAGTLAAKGTGVTIYIVSPAG